ncbi:uncharacterized protein N0V89_003880 [Didymosphaeria variabile]|uniref:Uncharacterized protein n=1 Tax=Didymosphaeria variabile TaxID=1932322 RepID=A0A9W8XP75_9PLEO|nr:uncharacterized protein N0V89_003880 [Didymosphaeria variabile]KAJ4355859.1 hypothetical protein N0V89_003880 [Didymosphaeria variabile]
MAPVYLVIKTVTEKDSKPDYEVDDIVPHGYSTSLPSNNSDIFTIYSYYTADDIQHVTPNITENYDIKLRWHYDPFPSPSVVAYNNIKEGASSSMHKEIDKFMDQEAIKSRISTKYDREGNLVFAYGLKTKEGENVCFELLVVEIGPSRRYGSELEITRKDNKERMKADAEGESRFEEENPRDEDGDQPREDALY